MTSASNTMASGKSYNNKNSKKLQEVKEVIQNKSDNDISKILEVFDNDVSKTINAFMTGKKNYFTASKVHIFDLIIVELEA